MMADVLHSHWGHKRQTEELSQMEETRETGLPNAVWDSESDPRPEKDMGGTIEVECEYGL